MRKAFDCFPTETVEPKDLQRGDIAKLHNHWEIVVEVFKKEADPYHQGDVYDVVHLARGASSFHPFYFERDRQVTIVKRGVAEANKIEQLIVDELTEQKRQDELREKEDRRERARERKHLLRQLEELGSEDLDEIDEDEDEEY